ncbi:MAG: phospholipase [Proteobacteria bacterium]|nr:phospholipase [Pseudomonadota bacterium]MBU4382327.1 phospholipase [Pseudomonadota bacterium]MCG2765991.1 phospholipase D-like domain-containing protein [Desulfarculaceae bacterium]
MKFINGKHNRNYLRGINDSAIGNTEEILLAVAYASYDVSISDMFDLWWKEKIKVTFYCRIDYTIPVAPPLLEKFLRRRSPNFECKLIKDILHAKVIWWKGFGAYIGSANLSGRSWYSNIEAGLFLPDEELIGTDTEFELEELFSIVDGYSQPLTHEIFNYILEYQKAHNPHNIQENLKRKFENPRSGLGKLMPHISRGNSNNAQQSFLKEWIETLQYLRDIADRVSSEKYRPLWINEDTPKGVQADQFLHAYYYGRVREGVRVPYNEFFEKNKNDPESALVEAMRWWSALESAPNNEDYFIDEWYPYLKRYLEKYTVLNLTLENFIGVCSRVHAIREHCLRVTNSFLGPSAIGHQFSFDEKLPIFSEVLFNKRSRENKSVLETIQYVLYGGHTDRTPERIWEGCRSDKWKIDHFGLSALGEIVGWAMPDKFPPRNDRTNKALIALGYNVKKFAG